MCWLKWCTSRARRKLWSFEVDSQNRQYSPTKLIPCETLVVSICCRAQWRPVMKWKLASLLNLSFPPPERVAACNHHATAEKESGFSAAHTAEVLTTSHPSTFAVYASQLRRVMAESPTSLLFNAAVLVQRHRNKLLYFLLFNCTASAVTLLNM